jgi:hypothetical protein
VASATVRANARADEAARLTRQLAAAMAENAALKRQQAAQQGAVVLAMSLLRRARDACGPRALLRRIKKRRGAQPALKQKQSAQCPAQQKQRQATRQGWAVSGAAGEALAVEVALEVAREAGSQGGVWPLDRWTEQYLYDGEWGKSIADL